MSKYIFIILLGCICSCRLNYINSFIFLINNKKKQMYKIIPTPLNTMKNTTNTQKEQFKTRKQNNNLLINYNK